ncbi:MAG: LamG domain-containing protein, partial [Candidatus Aenigmatarchaeota archaeon]
RVEVTQLKVFVNEIADSGATVPSSILPGYIGTITLSAIPVGGDVIKVSTGQGAIAIKIIPGGTGCVPDGTCNGVCPIGCTLPSQDPDCGCQDNDGICCAAAGCNSGNDNNCVAPCTADGDPCLTGSQCCNGFCVSGICAPCISGTNCGSPCSSGAYAYSDGTHTCEGSANNACNVLLLEGQGDCDCDANCPAGMYCEELGSTDRCCPLGTNWDSGSSSCVAPGSIGLVGFWKLDGDATDSSTNTNDGTRIGGSWVGGVSNLALALNGADEYVNIPNNPTLDMTEEITVMAWIYHKNYDTCEIVITMKEYSWRFVTGGTWTNGAGANTLSLQIWNSTGTQFNHYADVRVPLNEWHHVAAVWDGSNVYYYFDGQPAGSDAHSTGMQASAENVYIGMGSGDCQGFFNGTIDEVKLWDVALTPADILQEYQLNAPSSNGLVGFWSFDENLARDDDSYRDGSTGGNTYDDGANKWLIVDPSTIPGANASLYIYGRATSCNSTASTDYRLRINDVSAQTINFNWCDAFGLDTGTPLVSSLWEWIRMDVPKAWLINGENKFNFWDGGGVCRWDCANWNIGIDTNNDYSRSAWCSDCGEGTNPIRDTEIGELMMYLSSSDKTILDSADSNDATLGDGVPVDDEAPSFASGRYGYSLRFDNINDYVTINSVADDIVGKNFSAFAWIRTSSTAEDQEVISIHDSYGNNRLLFRIRDGDLDGVYGMDVHNGVSWIGSPTTDTRDGAWHHVGYAFDFTHDSITVYVDGDIEYSTSFTLFEDIASNFRVSVGQDWDGNTPTDFFDGRIDEVRFYDSFLTTAQVGIIM